MAPVIEDGADAAPDAPATPDAPLVFPEIDGADFERAYRDTWDFLNVQGVAASKDGEPLTLVQRVDALVKLGREAATADIGVEGFEAALERARRGAGEEVSRRMAIASDLRAYAEYVAHGPQGYADFLASSASSLPFRGY